MNISALMLTTKARWWSQALAIETWLLNQRTPGDELVIVSEDIIDGGALLQHPQIRMVCIAPGVTLPEKRNIGAEACKNAWIAFWDDDDWHGVRRLEALRAGAAHFVNGGSRFATPQIVGMAQVYFHELLGEQRSFLYAYPSHDKEDNRNPDYVVGGTMMFDKGLWKKHPFQAYDTAGDEGWWTVDRLKEGVPRAILRRGEYVAFIHGANTCAKPPRVNAEGRVLSDAYMTKLAREALWQDAAHDVIPFATLARYAAAAWAQSGEQE
jgi:hypothetical protein